MNLTVVFGLTTFLSAFLMFWLELFFAKLLLPRFGGGSAIWTTCLACFQLLLLLGYLYAHWLGKASHRVQKLVHISAIALALLFLPIELHRVENLPNSPVLQILITVLVSIGLPMIMLSTTSSLLQSWFSQTDKNPYFLYSLSNGGSLLALMVYPTVIEPRISLSSQSKLWAVCFMLALVGVIWCLFQAKETVRSDHEKPVIALWQRLRWLFYAFIPSSLLAGITTYTTSDVAPSPLVWSIFLGLYLFTLILVFCPIPLYPPADLGNVLVFFALAFLLIEARSPSRVSNDFLTANIVIFTGVAWIYHARLAASKPDPENLTEFYLFQAIGGAMGALFNAIAAPLIFTRLIEYQVVLAIALPALLYVPQGWEQLQRSPLSWLHRNRWIAPLGSVLVVILLIQSPSGWGMKLERSVRSFYGAYQIGTTEVSRILLHGVTIHGQEFLATENQSLPGSYYAKGSPISNVFDHTRSNAKVAIVGLGAGEIGTYSQPEQEWTFYEIDPLMVDIAKRNFKHLANMPRPAAIVVGDGRLKVAESTQIYDLIVIDAFSSDAIPLHLLTIEVLQNVFLPHLSKEGTIAYHITNQYVDLEGPLERLATATGLDGLVKHDRPLNSDLLPFGTATDWVVLTRNPAIGQALKEDGWQSMKEGTIPVPGGYANAWSDDFTNLYGSLKRNVKKES